MNDNKQKGIVETQQQQRHNARTHTLTTTTSYITSFQRLRGPERAGSYFIYNESFTRKRKRERERNVPDYALSITSPSLLQIPHTESHRHCSYQRVS